MYTVVVKNYAPHRLDRMDEGETLLPPLSLRIYLIFEWEVGGWKPGSFAHSSSILREGQTAKPPQRPSIYSIV